MGVLFMTPNWAAPSEVWMQRMLEELGKDLDTVLAWDTGGAATWCGRARAVSLSRNTIPSRCLRVFLRSIGISQQKLAQIVLKNETKRREITRILCHYGAFAVSFMDVWRSSSVPLFILSYNL